MTGHSPPDEPRIVTGPEADSTGRFDGSRRAFLAAAATTGAALTIGGTAIASQQDASASATFDDQTTDGSRVTVASAELSDGGFIAIHDSSLLDGAVLDSVVGVSEALDSGSHQGIEVALFEGVPGRDFDRDALQEDETLIAMPHFDSNNNGSYDFITSEGEKDGPYTKDGEAVVDDAKVTVKSGGGNQQSASVTFDDQNTDGTTVMVKSATLPKGGFIAIHDSSLLDGAVLDSVVGVSEALDSGSHQGIEVALFEGVPGRDFDRDALQEDETLIAMPHFDTDGDGRYDFVCSGGEKDGPYTKDGEAVVDDAKVTVE